MKLLKILTIAVVAIFTTQCKTDVEIGAPYEKIPVIYALLNPNDTIHYIKITRAFNGTGNSQELAKIPDSSYFQLVNANIEEIVDAEVQNTYPVYDTIITNKEEGAFYGPEQKIYYFYKEGLNPDATYRLVADIDEGDLLVEAETDLIGNLSFSAPQQFSSFNFATPNSSNDNQYNSTLVKWNSNENAALYGLSAIFSYDEEYVDGSVVRVSKRWNLGNFDEDDVTNGGVSISMLGENFYKWLGDNVGENSQVVKRIFRSMTLELSAADETLKTYIEVTEPVTGIVQSKPDFTNIKGGRGIFASRSLITYTLDKGLNNNSMLELCRGQYTGALLFCSDKAEHSTQTWYCN